MSQIGQFFLRNLAIYATKIENPPLGGEFSQTLVWGKQSVWLSACRTPDPNGENRAEARTHFEPVTKARKPMPEKRKRNLTLTIRVTPGEKDAILRKAKQADMTLTDYLVTSALSTQIFVAEDLKPALSELKRIGNNLNQIATKIHVGAFQSYNFSEVIQWQRKLYEELVRIGGSKWRL